MRCETTTGRPKAVILLLLLALCAAPALALADFVPVSLSAWALPARLSAPGEVTVTIEITNIADGDLPEAIELFDPEGTRVQVWPSLSMGSTVSYSGPWQVTSGQLEAGKLSYTVAYPLYNEETREMGRARQGLSVAVQRAQGEAVIAGDTAITPKAASTGQAVTLTYTLANTGSATARGVTLRNFGEKVFFGDIAPGGEAVRRAQTVRMGEESMLSQPVVSWQEGEDGETKDLSLPQEGIQWKEPDLLVTASVSEGLVTPGARVEVVCEIENVGEVTYTGMSVVELSLGELMGGITLEPGARQVVSGSLLVEADALVTFTVLAVDPAGQEVTFWSNALGLSVGAH